MEIDLADQAILFEGGRIARGGRLAKFLALLAATCTTPERALTAAKAAAIISPDLRFTRVMFGQLNMRAAKLFGSRNPISGEHNTTGPWRLARDREPISVHINGRKLSPEDILAHLAPPAQVAMVPPLLPAWDIQAILALSAADLLFAQGLLADAERAYAAIEDQGLSDFGATVALLRLLQTYRRREKYPELRLASRRLKARAASIRDEPMSAYLTASAELALAWYDYTFDHRYDLAWRKLSRLEKTCSRFSTLHIDWQNLQGLASRRRALATTGEKRAAEALNSIRLLETTLIDAVVVGNPYQIQQSAANLGNILSLFSDSRQAEIVLESDAVADSLNLMRLASLTSDHFGIGKDDLFTTIYLMSHARRHNLSADEVRAYVSLGGPSTSLARYGDAELHREGRVAAIGPEQRALLAREICHAAIRENDGALFARYAPIVADAAFELTGSLGEQFQRTIIALIALARPLNPRQSTWRESIAALQAGLSARRT